MATSLAIAHHIPGRIRLKLSSGANASLASAVDHVVAFCRHAHTIPGIRTAKLNPLAGSCVVEYDPLVIPPAAWEDLTRGRRTEPSERLVNLLINSVGAKPA